MKSNQTNSLIEDDGRTTLVKSVKDNSLSVVFMLTSLDRGGAETQVVELASKMIKKGWSVKVITMIPPRAFTERLMALGIDVESLDMRRGMPNPIAFVRLLILLWKWRPDVFHCHMVHANILGRIARLFVSTPVVISSAHSINEGGRIRELMYRLTDPLADLTTNVSHAAVSRYIEVGVAPKNRIKVVANGVDTNKFKPNIEIRRRIRSASGSDDIFVWIAVGRIEEVKDYPNLLHAFKLALAERKARLLIIGAGSLVSEIEEQIASLMIQNEVMLLGNRDDVSELLNAADAYVLSSRWEGLPMVLLEAAATGLPIVCTDVGGNREVVIPGVTGLVVPPEDPYELSRAMATMMRHTALHLELMGKKAREHIKNNYSLHDIVDKWESVYGELLLQRSFDR